MPLGDVDYTEFGNSKFLRAFIYGLALFSAVALSKVFSLMVEGLLSNLVYLAYGLKN
jgi:hypothetical protein